MDFLFYALDQLSLSARFGYSHIFQNKELWDHLLCWFSRYFGYSGLVTTSILYLPVEKEKFKVSYFKSLLTSFILNCTSAFLLYRKRKEAESWVLNPISTLTHCWVTSQNGRKQGQDPHSGNAKTLSWGQECRIPPLACDALHSTQSCLSTQELLRVEILKPAI